MPVLDWNMLEIFCAVATGTEQYQTTLPSFLAAAMSTACAHDGRTPPASVSAVPAKNDRRFSEFILQSPFPRVRLVAPVWLPSMYSERLAAGNVGVAILARCAGRPAGLPWLANIFKTNPGCRLSA